eukprot:scaffold50048_cov58-Phaeocystis_antarctica.AAC.2
MLAMSSAVLRLKPAATPVQGEARTSGLPGTLSASQPPVTVYPLLRFEPFYRTALVALIGQQDPQRDLAKVRVRMRVRVRVRVRLSLTSRTRSVTWLGFS